MKDYRKIDGGRIMDIKHKIEAFDTFLHVHLDNCSINIIRTDEGVVVDVWEKDLQGDEPIASTYAYNSELKPESETLQEICDLESETLQSFLTSKEVTV